ncbi:hypothetical protein Z045_16305 [Rhodococcus pyridinivorans KG-16]|uniref:Uncharacterized protein n=1 Tax=Rhodococcus pyridinivorans KG-16 TaxID=1441730 RepID=A0A0V9UHP9_9NOCA|nr:hypothetical protein [Rhodococcus pyridinivorans]KSZ57541.1 hypothetical protein Z045_16305 [Rhodococcus pyridinivorans KG-16]
MAAVRDDHEALISELLLLADAVLDRVEGTVQQFVTATGDASAHTATGSTAPGDAEAATTPSGCAWCPLCAAAALVRGENHELIGRLASKLAALIALLREFLAQFRPSTGGVPPEPTPDPPMRDRPAFEPISVNLRT